MRNSLIFVKNTLCSVRYWQTDYMYLKLFKVAVSETDLSFV